MSLTHKFVSFVLFVYLCTHIKYALLFVWHYIAIFSLRNLAAFAHIFFACFCLALCCFSFFRQTLNTHIRVCSLIKYCLWTLFLYLPESRWSNPLPTPWNTSDPPRRTTSPSLAPPSNTAWPAWFTEEPTWSVVCTTSVGAVSLKKKNWIFNTGSILIAGKGWKVIFEIFF